MLLTTLQLAHSELPLLYLYIVPLPYLYTYKETASDVVPSHIDFLYSHQKPPLKMICGVVYGCGDPTLCDVCCIMCPLFARQNIAPIWRMLRPMQMTMSPHGGDLQHIWLDRVHYTIGAFWNPMDLEKFPATQEALLMRFNGCLHCSSMSSERIRINSFLYSWFLKLSPPHPPVFCG